MSDIFISYASEDRERAKLFAGALESRGWSVWWDRKIPFGKSYDEVIAHNLEAAKCVLVLWTKSSAASRWVRTEASEGAAREALVPILLDGDVKIPLEFKLLQAANLADWAPDSAHPEFDRLIEHIRGVIDAAPAASPQASAAAPPLARALEKPEPAFTTHAAKSQRNKTAVYVLGLLVVPSVLIGGIAWTLMNTRIPSRVHVALKVERVAFTFAGTEDTPVLDTPVNFRSLTVENFAQLTFKPSTLWLPASAGPVPARLRELVLLRKRDASSATIESADTAAHTSGRLSALAASPGRSSPFRQTKVERPT